MTNLRDTFCSFCGTRYTEAATYPRTCTGCTTQVWANPVPVSVVLVPIVEGPTSGLLVVRRAIPPQIGKLALVGGFLEEHETWRQGGAREVFEETGLRIDAQTIEPLWFESSSPRPNRVMLFGVAAPVSKAALPPFQTNTETSERGVIHGPAGVEEVLAFSTHIEATQRYFAARGIAGPHAFTPA
ncbi:MAG: NUDIX domain-containing protein [Myxococcales bacterium]|nr:NUDIX domain-containing protein [Myxococcales bacterium]